MLQYICLTPEAVGSSSRLQARRGIPAGVSCNRTQWCDAAGCSQVCARGSVAVDTWLTSASRLQARLARALPFCFSTLFGTHNSAITLADGYGNLDPHYQALFKYVQWVAPGMADSVLRTNDQWFSLTDQLNMGVRLLELDTHWVGGVLRIAHCGGLHVAPLNALVSALNAVAKLLRYRIRWDTETVGCQPSLSSIPALEQRPLVEALEEVKAWMDAPGNEDELVVLFFDDQPDLETWGVVGRLLEDITSVFSAEAVFTQDDLGAAGGEWATAAEMVAAGHRLVLVSTSDYGEAMAPLIFPRGRDVCSWIEPGLGVVDGAPECALNLQPSKSGNRRRLFDGSIVRVSTCELEYGPLNCEFVWRGGNAPYFDEATLPGVMDCGLNVPSPDLLTPSRAAAAIWTWAPGHPFDAADQAVRGGRRASDGILRAGRTAEPVQCAVISADDARWRVAPCGSGTGGSASTPTACRRRDAPFHSDEQWVLGMGPTGDCPEGSFFDLPRHPRENYLLGAALREAGLAAAWLPISGPEWAVDGVPAYRTSSFALTAAA